jgi:hypothetical protein
MTPLQKSLEILKCSELEAIELAKAKALMVGYDLKWGEQQWHTEGVEDVVGFEIGDTGWTYKGKVDTLVSGYGHDLVMMEHKTTTQDLSDQLHPYFTRLTHEGQVSRYHLALYLEDKPISQTVYDVIRKLSIKPKSIPIGTPKKLLGSRLELQERNQYYGYDVGEHMDWESTPATEDIRLYYLRCLHTVTTQHEKYYVRVGNITRDNEALKDTYTQLLQIVDDIQRAEARGAWYQNTNSCNSYNSPCEYLSLCRGLSSESDVVWRERKGGETSGDTTLSHSKASCFMSCRRKYYYRYVRKIEPDRPASAALTFGSAIHLALEEYWKNKGEEDDCEERAS